MFSNVTWWQFIAVLIIVWIIYYPVILWLYYRKEIKALFARVTPAYSSAATEEDALEEPFTITEEIEGDIKEQTMPEAALIADLMQEVKTGVQISIDTKASKDQILALIKAILSRYSELKSFPQRVQLNEFIIEECKRAKVFLSIAQVYALWVSGSSSATT